MNKVNHVDPLEMVVEGFNVCGISVRTINTDEFNESTAKIGKLWEHFYSEAVVEQIPNRVPDSPYYGVYSHYDSDDTAYYTVTAGVKVNCKPSPLLDLDTVSVPPGCYLVFSDKGSMPQVVVETWARIWSYFEEHQEYRRNFEADFEMYSADDDIAIYIGVTKK